jgi:outer membrane lipoprotein-sorting protein
VLRVIRIFPILFVGMHYAVAMSPAPADIIRKMNQSYVEVTDYQTNVLVRRHEGDGPVSEWRFTYTFKKPGMIRMDFQSSPKGMVMVYSEDIGKVVVQPFPWAPLVKLRLSPDSSLIAGPSGQRIDQTSMGQLIENIGKSLTTGNRDEPVIGDSEDMIDICVLAENHFHPDRLSRYEFCIDKTRWLPVAVSERTPEGMLEREVRFQDLRTNIGIADSFFK